MPRTTIFSSDTTPIRRSKRLMSKKNSTSSSAHVETDTIIEEPVDYPSIPAAYPVYYASIAASPPSVEADILIDDPSIDHAPSHEHVEADTLIDDPSIDHAPSHEHVEAVAPVILLPRRVLNALFNWNTAENLSRGALLVAGGALLSSLGGLSLLPSVFSKLGYSLSANALLGTQISSLILSGLALERVTYFAFGRAINVIQSFKKQPTVSSRSGSAANQPISLESSQTYMPTFNDQVNNRFDGLRNSGSSLLLEQDPVNSPAGNILSPRSPLHPSRSGSAAMSRFNDQVNNRFDGSRNSGSSLLLEQDPVDSPAGNILSPRSPLHPSRSGSAAMPRFNDQVNNRFDGSRNSGSSLLLEQEQDSVNIFVAIRTRLC